MQPRDELFEVDRSRRVSELIRRALAQLIVREVADKRVRMASISRVTIGRDLKRATVYFSCIDANANPDEVARALNHAAKYLRFMLGKRVNLRATPGLLFKHDDSIRRGFEMSQLIDSLNASGAHAKKSASR